MSAAEFGLWSELYRIDPWGGERGDLRMGILAALIANMMRTADDEAYQPSDFMPDFDPKPKSTTRFSDIANFIQSMR